MRRRAITSVAANPNCKDRETAERVVNEVFDSCFKDTRPFDEVRLSFYFGGVRGGADEGVVDLLEIDNLEALITLASVHYSSLAPLA